MKLAEIRASLLGPRPLPVEVLLVERIAACWLQVNYVDASGTSVVTPNRP